MAVTEKIDQWHADIAHLNGWKRDAIADAVGDDVAAEVRALRIAHVLSSYNLQLSALESWYTENAMPELSEEEYKNFKQMQAQGGGCADKIVLLVCAVVIFWVLLGILSAFAAAKA